MAQVVGPDFIGLQVRDRAVSRRFYEGLLGLDPSKEGPPHAVVYRTEPIPFAIRDPLQPLEEANRLGWGMVLWLACEDVDALHARLAAAGVPIVQPLQDGPFGRVFACLDPDGYRLTLHGKKI